MKTLNEKCEKLLAHGLILELLQFHLEKEDEKLWMLFNLYSAGEKAAEEVRKIHYEQGINKYKALEYEKTIILDIWNTIDNLEEKHKNIEVEIAALKYSLIKNPVFRKHFKNDYGEKIEKKCEDILNQQVI